MTKKILPFGESEEQDPQIRRLLLMAGTVYGIIFGLSFAFFTWGIDAYLLGAKQAATPWVKLALGLPLSVVLAGIAGWLAALTPSLLFVVIIWGGVGGLLTMIAGHIPFEGSNLVIWLMDPRFANQSLFAFGEAAATRTTLMVFISVIVGLVVGYIETLAIQWAWDRATPQGRLSLPSLLALMVAAPIAILPALNINYFMNQPLRTPQLVLGDVLGRIVAGEDLENAASGELVSSYRSFRPYLDQLSTEYETHLVTFGSDTGTWYSAYIDIVFKDGKALRCVSTGKSVVYCDDFSKRLAEWMQYLVRAGLYGERPWLDSTSRRLVVDEGVVAWLADRQGQLSENYALYRAGQQSGFVLVIARFDTGFEMVCRIKDAQPAVVDLCAETQFFAE